MPPPRRCLSRLRHVDACHCCCHLRYYVDLFVAFDAALFMLRADARCQRAQMPFR